MNDYSLARCLWRALDLVLHRLLRCRNVEVIQDRAWRCERWLHLGKEHR